MIVGLSSHPIAITCSASCPVSSFTSFTDAAKLNMPYSGSCISASVRSCSPMLASSCSSVPGRSMASVESLRGFYFAEICRQRASTTSLRVLSVASPNDGVKWWERDGGANMIDVHSIKELKETIATAGEKLVVVEFYATWCGSCRALYPKLCRIAADHMDIVFLKVNFDENKPLCKILNVKVLPYFHLYRGADGLLDAFSCSITKLQKLKDAIATHNTDRCSLGPPVSLQDDTLDSSRQCTPDEAAATGSAR